MSDLDPTASHNEAHVLDPLARAPSIAANESMPTYVFISHNSADKAQAIRLARALEARGIPAWVDAFELRPDSAWEPALYRAVEHATVVLACIGEHGKGPWQDRELEHAAKKD